MMATSKSKRRKGEERINEMAHSGMRSEEVMDKKKGGERK
jgi:hypothetical protein